MVTKLANSNVVLVCAMAIGIAMALPSVADFDLNTAVGIWHLDDGEGEVTKDSSAEGNNGDLWRGPVWVDGKFGKALEFDGQSFVWVKNATGIPEGTSPRTFVCHFKWSAVNDWANAVLDASDAEILMGTGPSAWRARVSLGLMVPCPGGVCDKDGGPGVDNYDDREFFVWEGDTEWHHLAGVFPEGATHSSEWLVYFDGELQETQIDNDDTEINSTGGQVTIGCMSGRIANFFNGTIDEVAILPFAMAAEDIASVAKRGLVRGQQLDVGPTGKLAMSWGELKQR